MNLWRYRPLLGIVTLVIIGLSEPIDSVAGQTLIRNWYDLDSVRHNLNGDYKLVANLDSTTKGYYSVASAQANGGKGFDPIDSTYITSGIQYHLPFTGSFNGNGHTIRHLQINRPNSDYVALFGYIRNATIKKVGVAKADIQGYDHVAILIGQIGKAQVGFSFSDVKKCFTTGSVNANDVKAGGLIGDVEVNTTDIIRCYSHADVNGVAEVGGLIGSISSGSLFSVFHPKVEKAYATGSISSVNPAGGLIGKINLTGFIPLVNQIFVGNFWDTQKSGLTGNGVGNLYGNIVGINGKNTNKLQKLSTFTNASWQIAKVANFTAGKDHWKIFNNKTYPLFGWELLAYRTVFQGPNNWSNLDRWQVFNNRSSWVPAPRIPAQGGPPARIIVRHNMVIQVQTNVDVKGILVLRDGIIENKSTFKLKPNAVVKGADANSYVDGPLTREGIGSQYFPVGSSGKFAPAKLNVKNTGSGVVPSAKISYVKQGFNPGLIKNASQLESVSHYEHWNVNLDTGNADLTLYWKDANYSNISKTQYIRTAYWNGQKWELEGRDTLFSEGNTGRIRVNDVSRFGKFTFGSTNAQENPLPVELTDFKISQKNGKVHLAWETASETNNSHFIVQRRYREGGWQQIDSVPGNKTTYQAHTYASIDPNPKKGYNYYRLKQVDYNGDFEYSGVKAIRFSPDQHDQLSVVLKGNPLPGDKLKIEVRSPKQQTIRYELLNIKGSLVYKGRWQIKPGEEDRSMSLSDLPSGTYLLNVLTPDKQIAKKVIY